MNRRGSDRKRRFDDDNDVAGDFFDRNHKRRHDDDVEDKLDDVIKLLKKILKELDEIEDELEDDNHGGNHNNHGKCKCKNHHGKCNCKKDDDDCDCDTVLMQVRTNPSEQTFGEILNVVTSDGDFGCDLTTFRDDPPRGGANAAKAIACLKCKGFKVAGFSSGTGNTTEILLTRKKCNNKCDDNDD